MYVMVSVTLSSIISVIISSKINSVVIDNKILIASVVDNVSMNLWKTLIEIKQNCQ